MEEKRDAVNSSASDEPVVLDPALTEPVEWFLDHLRVERGASAHTAAAYHNDLTQAAEFLVGRGLHDWKDLTAVQLMAFESSLATKIKRTTALRRVSSVRSFLKFLKRKQQPLLDGGEIGAERKRRQ